MTTVSPLQRLRLGSTDAVGVMIRVLRLGGLVALLWATAAEHHSDGSPRVPVALLVCTALAWLGWLLCQRLGAPVRASTATLVVLSGAGAAVGGLAPVGIAFPAVAVIATATAAGVGAAIATAGVGAAAITTTVLVAGSPHAIIVEGLMAIAAAVLGGASRRQFQERAAQAEQLLAERSRAEAEHARAVTLAERNRIGQEIHDVLAHSLGALSVQLDAADALLDAGADRARAREHVRRARGLAVDGLVEARHAVHALRDGPMPLGAQLTALAGGDGATLSITGRERRLDRDTEHALFRAAQEALANARKHAPGAAVTMTLDYGELSTVLTVTNDTCAGRQGSDLSGGLSATGGGFGLRGMRERIETVGGQLSTSARSAGWTVRAEVPG